MGASAPCAACGAAPNVLGGALQQRVEPESALAALDAPRRAPRPAAKKRGVLGLVIAGLLAASIVGGGVGMLLTGRQIKERRQDLTTMAQQAARSPALLRQEGAGAMAVSPGLCWILSEPRGAEVFVGDQLLGRTPVQLAVAGLRIRLELLGRKKFQGEARCGELVFLAEATAPRGAPPPAPAPAPAPF